MTVGRSTSRTHQIGAAAEDAAVLFVKQQGGVVVVQNYNTPYGELDIVALKNKVLIFMEVRLRKARSMVSATESVTIKKQTKIIHSAMQFLQQYPQFAHYDCRFDVIALSPVAKSTVSPTYKHLSEQHAALQKPTALAKSVVEPSLVTGLNQTHDAVQGYRIEWIEAAFQAE